ncbi:hypothetical protein BASA50_003173 [Batrachochytrium salamandrivorans]|uniref:SET domain-containing protein n=1 Tax=Batrachochytrium salamandrivorans TaxID=1357716 RepID=A0ABQ8FM61_9FUNG|nr:hypothetical protein BASA60_008350 [Batrachochytrium salamandrivorans]KAH6599230.1 hypothetical protein BASA50_003173 [Batrachochytrium salamandrivorans]KAH9253810.1 hypothetical protein BASA81_008244 [Batrachochytrium salamandrivorans]KAH9273284.1 hypothetical protein BASA83_004279 [Batrachochytrium salamandrivorans]
MDASSKGTVVLGDSRWSAFQVWLEQHGLSHPSLVLAYFPDTGRGLMATADFEEGDILVRIPARVLLTPKRTHLLFNGHPAIVALKQHPSIALFIAWQALHRTPEWGPYMDILPQSFDTMPLCMPLDMLKALPYDIQAMARDQRTKIDTDYRLVCEALVTAGYGNIPMATFEWAWIVVNTRCISMNTATMASETPTSISGMSLVGRRPQITLAPFLDCLNHTPSARISAGYNAAEKAYVIRTLVPYPKGSEVHINYGPHDNNFLLAEYGFVVPNNPYNHVVLDREVDNEMVGWVAVMELLKSEGMHGEYIVADEDIGYRIINAMRLLVAVQRGHSLVAVLPAWRRVLGGTLPYISKELESATLERLACIFKAKLTRCQQALESIDKKNFMVPLYALLFSKKILNETIQTLEKVIDMVSNELSLFSTK